MSPVGTERKRFTAGTYPDVKLAAARDAWRPVRQPVRETACHPTVPGITPTTGDTFGTVLDEWLAQRIVASHHLNVVDRHVI